jgi:hypothetical protein
VTSQQVGQHGQSRGRLRVPMVHRHLLCGAGGFSLGVGTACSAAVRLRLPLSQWNDLDGNALVTLDASPGLDFTSVSALGR